jgi:MFS family permease
VATLSTVGSAVAALAAIAGGAPSGRIGRRRALVVGWAGVAAFNLAFVLCRGMWASYAFQLGFAATSAVASGIVYASLLALFMDLAHPRLAATHFQVSMALLNLRGVWGNRLGGRLAERVAPATMFGAGAILELLPLVLLPWLNPKKAKAGVAGGGKTD